MTTQSWDSNFHLVFTLTVHSFQRRFTVEMGKLRPRKDRCHGVAKQGPEPSMLPRLMPHPQPSPYQEQSGWVHSKGQPRGEVFPQDAILGPTEEGQEGEPLRGPVFLCSKMSPG